MLVRDLNESVFVGRVMASLYDQDRFTPSGFSEAYVLRGRRDVRVAIGVEGENVF